MGAGKRKVLLTFEMVPIVLLDANFGDFTEISKCDSNTVMLVSAATAAAATVAAAKVSLAHIEVVTGG